MAATASAAAAAAAAAAAVRRFAGFLRIRTDPVAGPQGTYAEAVAYLKAQAEALGGLETTVLTYVPNKPVLVIKWAGREPELPAVLFNSHYDVVPAVEALWRTPPFEPTVTDDGKIIARGTQDMKCVCMQYLEALACDGARVAVDARQGSPFRRTVYLSFMPDEEVGGADGAGRFTQSAEFRAMNVGVALDEGLASPSDAFTVFYGERAPWFFTIKATGPTGHGSRFIENPAAHKLVDVINKALAFRAEQEARLDEGCSHGVATKLGDVVSLNLTALKAGLPGPAHFGGACLWPLGGYALNVVPPEAEAGFDIRIPPTVSMDVMQATLNSWLPADGSVAVTFHARVGEHNVTSIDPAQNPWWAVFTSVFSEHQWAIVPEVFPAATDSRYLRALGIPCFGFSPMRRTPILLHDHNEYIDRDVYLHGIHVYDALMGALANAPATTTAHAPPPPPAS